MYIGWCTVFYDPSYYIAYFENRQKNLVKQRCLHFFVVSGFAKVKTRKTQKIGTAGRARRAEIRVSGRHEFGPLLIRFVISSVRYSCFFVAFFDVENLKF